MFAVVAAQFVEASELLPQVRTRINLTSTRKQMLAESLLPSSRLNLCVHLPLSNQNLRFIRLSRVACLRSRVRSERAEDRRLLSSVGPL